jgi:hypothetical protein
MKDFAGYAATSKGNLLRISASILQASNLSINRLSQNFYMIALVSIFLVIKLGKKSVLTDSSQ